MDLKIKHFVVFVTFAFFLSCNQKPVSLNEIRAKLLPVATSLTPIDSVEAYILPYRERVNNVLDSVLAFAPRMITKDDGEYNTSAGNLMADILLSAANPIFKSRTGNEIDFALMNHGGIRAIISTGNVTAQTAFEVMPFENSIAVVELKGTAVLHMVEFLIESGRAHPIAGIQITLNPSGKLKAVTINGEPVDQERTYFIATSDYLVSGGDNMIFFKEALSVTNINYLIRNAIIDHFKKVDTLSAAVDDRFIQLN